MFFGEVTKCVLVNVLLDCGNELVERLTVEKSGAQELHFAVCS